MAASSRLSFQICKTLCLYVPGVCQRLQLRLRVMRRWFLTNNFIYIMHFTIGLCCAIAMWATLCLFAHRLARAISSAKRWSPRRRAMCTYTAALVAVQVGDARSPQSSPVSLQHVLYAFSCATLHQYAACQGV